MVKIRLWGTKEEVQRAVTGLERDPKWRLLSVSEPYADRGKSQYCRVYIDAEYIGRAGGDDG